MRITIESTEQSKLPNCDGIFAPKIIIEYPSDELTASDAVIHCAKALVAYGFSSSNIAECLNEELSDWIHLESINKKEDVEAVRGCCRHSNE